MERRAKIIATIGPSSQDEETLRKMMEAGMDVARLNFSHGSHADHLESILKIRKLSKAFGKPVSILQDLQGPKLRVGVLPSSGIVLTAGQPVRLCPSESLPQAQDEFVQRSDEILKIPLEVPDLMGTLNHGDQVLLDDGHFELVVESVGEDYIQAVVKVGGILKSHKGVNLPGIALKIPALTEKDIDDLKFGLCNEIDYLAISFVRRAEDIELARSLIRKFAPENSTVPIIAKLERPEAIDRLDEILNLADGVMVARGDLGVETSLFSVPIIQKRIIQAANKAGRIVITATQMLESMISSPRPTRAEASDVANAIFDGTDAVMLSGETAAGRYPVESIQVMAHIIHEAECHMTEWGHSDKLQIRSQDNATTITLAAREMVNDFNVTNIAVFTKSGKTALMMSKTHPSVPILALTPEVRTLRKLGLYWGVVPFLVPPAYSVETMLGHVENTIINSTGTIPGEQVVVICGYPIGLMRPPNFILLHTIGESTSINPD